MDVILPKMKKALRLLSILLAALMLTACASRGGEGKTTTEGRVTSPLANMTEEAELSPAPSDATAANGSFSLRFTAAGDNIIHTSVLGDAHAYAFEGSADTAYSFSAMFGEIAYKIASADIAFVSQESVTAGAAYGYSGYPSYNCPSDIADDLVSIGFDVVNFATNHMLDMGRDGLYDCLNRWRGLDVTVLSGLDDAPYKIVTYYAGGDKSSPSIDIAYLCYTFNAGEDNTDMPILSEAAVMRDITAAEEAADLTVVSVHWGEETEYIAGASQEKWASTMCALGADVILGTHPYMLQKIEYVTAANGNTALCAYSLGNLLSGMLYPRMLLGGLLSFDINVTLSPEGEKTVATSNVSFEPTFCHYDENDRNFRVYMLADYSDALAVVHGAQKKEAFTLADIKRWLRESVSTAILPEGLK